MRVDQINYELAETYGAFGKYALDFAASLEKQQYTRSSVWIYKNCLARLGQLAGERNLSITDIDEVVAVDLAAGMEQHKRTKISPAFVARRFVRTLADQGLCKPCRHPALGMSFGQSFVKPVHLHADDKNVVNLSNGYHHVAPNCAELRLASQIATRADG